MDLRMVMAGWHWELIVALMMGGMILALVLWWIHGRKRSCVLLVGRVSGLYVYPLKSAAGVQVDQALCTPQGLQLPNTSLTDRSLMVTTADYNFITLRQKPSLSQVNLTINDKEIYLNAPSMDELVLKLHLSQPTCTVRLWGQRKSAVDCGHEASAWMSRYLQQDGVRLCVAVPGPNKRFLKKINWKPYTPFYQQPQIKPHDQVAFSDMSPFMIASESSLMDLNSQLTKPVSMKNFRPSIVVSGCPPFDEDSWRHMEIGHAKFSFFMLCNRCMETQVDPDTGTRRPDQEPLKTLRTYRLVESVFGKSPIFGTHWVLDRPGRICVGDEVYVSKAS